MTAIDPGFSTGVNCDHRRYELRRRTYGNGTTHFVHQCLRCGTAGRSIKHALIGALTAAEAPPFDDELPDRFWAEERAQRDAEWNERREERRQEYADYLDSPGWRERRRLRLLLDRYVCQAQLAGCRHRATEVHHLTYDRVGNEPLFDLVSVCGPCHRAITAMDRPDLELAS